MKKQILPINTTLALLLAAPLAHGGYLAYAPINEQSSSIQVIDGEYAQWVTGIPMTINPRYIAANSDGTRVYVASKQTSDTDPQGSLGVIDAVGNLVLHIVDSIGTSPGGIAVQPPLPGYSERVYVSTAEGVTVIDGASMGVSKLSGITYFGEGTAVSESGQWLFVVGPNYNATGTGISMVKIDGTPTQVASASLVQGANTVAVRNISDTQFQTFVGNYGASTIDVVDWVVSNGNVTAYKVQTIVLTGDARPNDLALSHDGKTLFVANEGVQPLSQGDTGSSGNLASIDTTTFDVQYVDITGSFTGGYYGGVEIHPAAVAISPGDDRLFVTKRVWYTLDAGAYLSILEPNATGWGIISDIKLGNSSYGKGVFVGQECAECPRSFTPLSPPDPYTRPGAFGPYELLLLSFVAAGLGMGRQRG